MFEGQDDAECLDIFNFEELHRRDLASLKVDCREGCIESFIEGETHLSIDIQLLR